MSKYSQLKLDEIKNLVINDKWLRSLRADVVSEVEKTSQALVNRLKELEGRYERTLPELSKSIVGLTQKVEDHLNNMGLNW